MRKRQWIVFILLWALLLIPAACGKKGPPFLPESNIPFRVEQLNAERENEIIILKGRIIDPGGKDTDIPGDLDCMVYYAGYSLKNPPCEGCPVHYRLFRGSSEKNIINEEFICKISGKYGKGIHFFKVRLIDTNRAIGPFSDEAKLIIE